MARSNSSYIVSWQITLGRCIAFFNLIFGLWLPRLKLKQKDLTGKTVIVTGANSGLGYSIALSLAQQNAAVYMACRSISKGEAAATSIINQTGSKTVHVIELDTSSLKSVRKFAESWSKQIDILFNNAGIAATPTPEKISPDGLGLMYATNFAGSFLLISLLEKKLTSRARVVFTSSTGAFSGDINTLYTMPRLIPESRIDTLIYSDTKLMQILLARALTQRWSHLESGMTAHAFTPDYSATSVFDKMPSTVKDTDPLWHTLKSWSSIAISSEQGALTGVWLGISDDPRVVKGGDFWSRQRRLKTAVDLVGKAEIDRAWKAWCDDSGAIWEER